MKRFKPYTKLLAPVKTRFYGAVIAGVIAGGASGLGLPLMLEKVFPIIFGNDEEAIVARQDLQQVLDWIGLTLPSGENLVFIACLIMPTVFVVRGVAGFFNKYLINYCGLKLLESIRIKTYERLQNLSLAFHQKYSDGDLLSRILTDTNHIQLVMVKVAADLIVQPLTLAWAMGYLVYASVTDQASFFMLIAMLSVPVCVLPIRFLGRKLLKRAKQLQQKLGDMTAVATENLASQREIRAFNLQESEVDALRKETSLFLKARMKVVKYSNMVGPMVEIVAAFGVSIAIYFGVQNEMTLEKFIPLVAALYFAYEPIKKLGGIHGAIRTGEAALDRIEEILHSDDEIKEVENPKSIDKLKGEVKFENVSFAYTEKGILSEINVSVEAGQTVALVGPSGVGKSSFISLIPRFYDTSSGLLQIDDVDVREFDKQQLRQNIAIVSQTPVLFSGTIADNILMGRKNASAEEVKQAAIRANADSFISTLPDGYDTIVGERGQGLSVGQGQRVAIARAFLRDAPILILDEATSSLDTESESLIQQSLEDLSKGRTTFIIAHRFSSIKHAPRILVFDKVNDGGCIIADGDHDTLYEECKLYKELYDHQS